MLEGLEGIAAGTGQKFDSKEMEQILAGLSNRIFLLNNTHEDAPEVFETRWAMNTSRSAFWLSARLPQLLRMPVTSSILAKVYRSQLGKVPTIGILSGEFWEPESAFTTGRFLMQFWLETAKHDLYIHPYGNMVTNKRASAWLFEETKIPDIWLIFKIGYSDVPPKSYRRSVEEILLA